MNAVSILSKVDIFFDFPWRMFLECSIPVPETYILIKMLIHKEESLSFKCITGEAASQGCSRITHLESDSPLDDQTLLIILVKTPTLKMRDGN